MTYKAALAGLDLGGGKAVILGHRSIKSEGLFRAFGRFVDSLGGRYITAEDMNTNVGDMNFIRRETRHVTGVGAHEGGHGDPSPVTAWGVFHGIRASLEVVYGTPEVSGRTVGIMGVGNVGWHLAEYLHERGANLVFADINAARVDEAVTRFGGTVVSCEDYFAVECDVLAPCAIGGVVNARTIPTIRAPILCGGANNILEDERVDAVALGERNITYAPDYVVNAGGLISVYSELKGWPKEKAMADSTGIFDTTKRILNKAQREGCTTIDGANRLAEERIATVARIHQIYTSS
jgi:leucine dehydrogenase